MAKNKKAVDGRDIKVYLSDSQINIATLIGGGGARDTSKGIRIALAYYYDHVIADASPDNVVDSAPLPAPTPKPSASPRPSPGFVSVAEMERRMAQSSDDGFEPMSSEGLTPGELDEMRRNARSGEPITEADFNAGRVCTLPANA